MKLFYKLSLFSVLLVALSCDREAIFNNGHHPKDDNGIIDFQYKSTIQVGGEAAAEISAYDSKTKKLFVVNVKSQQISVFNISDINNPVEETPITVTPGSPNSVSVNKGTLAIAVEADPKQNPGYILLYHTESMTLLNSYEVGSLPDMVMFSPNGQYIVSANEGDPNVDYTIDTEGTISVIDVSSE